MKVIELQQDQPTLDELMGLAEDEVVILRQRDGSVFALAHIDEFTLEVESLKSNPEFLALLKRWSHGQGVISLQELRKDLAI